MIKKRLVKKTTAIAITGALTIAMTASVLAAPGGPGGNGGPGGGPGGGGPSQEMQQGAAINEGDFGRGDRNAAERSEGALPQQGPGGGGDFNPGGSQGDGGPTGQMPEMPSGEAPTGERPEMPSGEAPTGEMPEMPSGEAPTGERPEMPSGEAPTGERPEMPSGEAPTGEMPEMPSGEAPTGERPEMPSGEAPTGQKPDMKGGNTGRGEQNRPEMGMKGINTDSIKTSIEALEDEDTKTALETLLSEYESAKTALDTAIKEKSDDVDTLREAEKTAMEALNNALKEAGIDTRPETQNGKEMRDGSGMRGINTDDLKKAVEGLEDGEVKTNLETLISEYETAKENLKQAMDNGSGSLDIYREAEAKALEAIKSALKDAGIETKAEIPNGVPGNGQNMKNGRPGEERGMPGDNTRGNQNNRGDGNDMPGNGPGEDQNMPGNRPGGDQGMPGNSAPTEYSAANNVTEDVSKGSYSSVKDNENTILVDGKTVSITGSTISKTGDASGEDADFYGINAGILANNGADLTLRDVSVTTDGAHANGVFSYGSGTNLTITDSSITTTGNNSGGLMTTGGASLTASNVTIDTSGNSSAAIRTDRGGGTVNADNITGTTGGVGSPAIYSTADITVADSTLKADKSEAVVIEGGNSVTITGSDLTGNNSKLNGQSTIATNVLIYQSMSGDASEGNSEFTMTGGSLTSQTGCMFHVTNVTTTINLTDVALNYASDSDDLLVLSADSWGTSGKNGGNATVNLSSQEASGNITVDSVSGLVLNLSDGSTYSGAINSSNESSSVSVRLEEGSTWKLTGDSYITSFRGDISAIDLNGYTLYINGKAYN